MLAVVKAKTLVDVVAAQAEARKASEAEVVAIRAEAEKSAEDEFGAGFFQGYSDLKRRVALIHTEWNLTAFSEVDSDYWDMEALTAE